MWLLLTVSYEQYAHTSAGPSEYSAVFESNVSRVPVPACGQAQREWQLGCGLWLKGHGFLVGSEVLGSPPRVPP